MNKAPTIYFRGFTDKAEQDAALNISNSLSRLQSYVADFGSALSLFDNCGSQRQQIRSKNADDDSLLLLSKWMILAARDGAMTIFHFAKTMEGIKETVHKCPTLAPLIPRETVRAATKLFSQNFSDFEAIRHAVAHAGELSNTPDRQANNAFTGDYISPLLKMRNVKDAMITNTLQGRVFSNTIDGTVVSYELSSTTFENLNAVKVLFFQAFLEAEVATLKMDKINRGLARPQPGPK